MAYNGHLFFFFLSFCFRPILDGGTDLEIIESCNKLLKHPKASLKLKSGKTHGSVLASLLVSEHFVSEVSVFQDQSAPIIYLVCVTKKIRIAVLLYSPITLLYLMKQFPVALSGFFSFCQIHVVF